MTISAERTTEVRIQQETDTAATRKPQRRDRKRRRAWWLGLLTFVVLSWLAMFVLPTYLALDPAKSVVKLTEGVSLHYPLVLVHVGTGTIAMLTGLLQVWPRLRRQRPAVHRVTGRIYVLAVLVGAPALVTLIVLRARDLGDTSSSVVVGFSMLTILWVWATTTAFIRARQRRWADHRRLMIYSFAMTLSIMWSRFAYLVTMLTPWEDTRWVAENIGWFPWVVNLGFAHWWLNRTRRRPLVLPPAAARSATS